MILIGTVACDPTLEADVAARLSASTSFDLVLRCVDRSEVLALVRASHVDCLLMTGAPEWVDVQVATEARDKKIRFLALIASVEGVDRMTVLGATALAPSSSIDEIRQWCIAAPEVPKRTPVEGRDGALIAVWGPKGAPGRSSIALALSLEMARTDDSTILADLDLYGGDLLQMAMISEELPGLLWASRLAAKDEIDEAILFSELRRISPHGPVLLPGITRAELWPDVSPFGWSRLQSTLLGSFNNVVCDIGFCLEPSETFDRTGRNELARAVLSSASVAVACCRGDSIGVKRFLIAWEELTEVAPQAQIEVVVNRLTESPREVADLIQAATGHIPIALIPEGAKDLGKRLRGLNATPSRAGASR